MNRRLMLKLLPLALFLAVAAFFLVGLGRDPRRLPSVLIDQPAPALALPPLHDGAPGLASADLGGQVALVNVFASWCIPCRVEHPVLERLARDGVPVFGINYKDRASDAKAWLAQLGDPYARIGIDRDGRAAIEWGVYGVPETFVIDRAGRIRYRHVGPIQPDDLARVIAPLLAQLKS